MEGGRGTGKSKVGPVEDQSVHTYLASSGFWDREMICTVQAGNLARGNPIDEGIPLETISADRAEVEGTVELTPDETRGAGVA